MSSERRVALVIGNSNYQYTKILKNPKNDANDISKKLSKLDFDVITALDLKRVEFDEHKFKFEEKVLKADIALFFYAGHGVQIDGKNYLVPIDAQITSSDSLQQYMFHIDNYLRGMSDKASASLVFLDACRDNPFLGTLVRSFEDQYKHQIEIRSGLARMEKVRGTFIAYATGPDEVAIDGSGQNSPFTKALLEYIETPGLSVSDMMIDVRKMVYSDTNGRQEPWDLSSLRSRFYFIEHSQRPEGLKIKNVGDEWEKIKSTDSASILSRFKDFYHGTVQASYAEQRLEDLRLLDETRRHDDEWDAVKNSVDPEKLTNFCKDWPASPHFNRVQEKLRSFDSSNNSLSNTIKFPHFKIGLFDTTYFFVFIFYIFTAWIGVNLFFDNFHKKTFYTQEPIIFLSTAALSFLFWYASINAFAHKSRFSDRLLSLFIYFLLLLGTFIFTTIFWTDMFFDKPINLLIKNLGISGIIKGITADFSYYTFAIIAAPLSLLFLNLYSLASALAKPEQQRPLMPTKEVFHRVTGAINTAISRAPYADLDWVRKHIIYHNEASYFVIPNLYSIDDTNKDEELRALAMNQLAGVLSNLEVIRELREKELAKARKEETRESYFTVEEDEHIRNHGILSKARRTLSFAGWSEKSQKDFELFLINDSEGLTPLLVMLNEAS